MSHAARDAKSALSALPFLFAIADLRLLIVVDSVALSPGPAIRFEMRATSRLLPLFQTSVQCSLRGDLGMRGIDVMQDTTT